MFIDVLMVRHHQHHQLHVHLSLLFHYHHQEHLVVAMLDELLKLRKEKCIYQRKISHFSF
jgi:hypothetical protein